MIGFRIRVIVVQDMLIIFHIPNHHPAIVEKDTFESVPKTRKRTTSPEVKKPTAKLFKPPLATPTVPSTPRRNNDNRNKDLYELYELFVSGEIDAASFTEIKAQM